MALIKIGELSKKLIYPFIMGISFFVLFYMSVILSNGYQSRITFHPFCFTLVKCLIELASLILFFYQKGKNRENKGNTNKPLITTLPKIDLIADSSP